MALGDYSNTSLLDARNKASEILAQVRRGIDPAAPIIAPEAMTFEAVSKKFVEWKESVLLRSGSTIRKYQECLNNDLLPAIGQMDIAAIHATDVVPLIERIEKRSNSLARKNQELVTMIVKYAVQRGYRPPYTHIDLSGIIQRAKAKPKVIPSDLAATIKKIDGYADSVMRIAMRLQFFCFLRASETMGAEWVEIDFDKRQWLVPAERMKMKRPHVVPLSKQTVELLKELKKATGKTPYLFPSKHNEAAMVRDSLSKAFRSLGLGIVPHGCRTAASTWMRNNRFAPHVVEAQLSHIEENEIAGAYIDAPHLMYMDERVKMMQAWSNHLSK